MASEKFIVDGGLGIPSGSSLELQGTTLTSTGAELNILDGCTATYSELNILDGVTASTTQINFLDDDDLTAADLTKLAAITATAAEINDLFLNNVAAVDFTKLAAVTSSAAEMNLLDGVTATTTEINYLDVTTLGTSEDSKAVTQAADGTVDVASHNGSDEGLKLGGTLVTSTAAELNIMDGVTATATEINYLDDDDLTAADLTKLAGVTATAAEINYLDDDDLTAADLTKLAGVTATAAELNYLDDDNLTAADLTKLAAITATAAEINDLTSNAIDADDMTKLSNITATAAEINDLAGNAVDSDDFTKLSNITATAAEINDLTSNAVEGADFTKLSEVTSSSTELNYLDITTLGTSEDSKALTQSATGTVIVGVTSGNETFDIASHDLVDGGLKLGGTLVTASAAELNLLDGCTATTTELNLIDGYTGTTAELNYLDITTLGTAEASKALSIKGDSTWTVAGMTCADIGTVSAGDYTGDADVSGGTFTSSATQKKAIVEGAASNVDFGAYEVRAQTFESDVATGTAPIVVASTTKVANLNADLLDGMTTVDEDNMASNSATKIPTQQSVKAYVDSKNQFTISDGSNSTSIDADDTLTINGTSSEVEVSESSGTVTVGLPTNVDIAGDLTPVTFTMAEFTVDGSGNVDADGTLNVEGQGTLQAGLVMKAGGSSDIEIKDNNIEGTSDDMLIQSGSVSDYSWDSGTGHMAIQSENEIVLDSAVLRRGEFSKTATGGSDTIFSFAHGTFNACKVNVRISDGTDTTMKEMMFVSKADGSSPVFVEYGTVNTGDEMTNTWSVAKSGDDVVVSCTGDGSDTIKGSFELIK